MTRHVNSYISDWHDQWHSHLSCQQSYIPNPGTLPSNEYCCWRRSSFQTLHQCSPRVARAHCQNQGSNSAIVWAARWLTWLPNRAQVGTSPCSSTLPPCRGRARKTWSKFDNCDPKYLGSDLLYVETGRFPRWVRFDHVISTATANGPSGPTFYLAHCLPTAMAGPASDNTPFGKKMLQLRDGTCWRVTLWDFGMNSEYSKILAVLSSNMLGRDCHDVCSQVYWPK